MPSDQNLETVKAIYDAFFRGDIATILDSVTDDVDWATDAAGGAAPWWGERSGREEAAQFFAALGGAVEVTEFEPLAFAANDTEVMTFVRYGAKVRATGREIAMNIHHYFRFRDGKVEYYRGSEDTQQTTEALAG